MAIIPTFFGLTIVSRPRRTEVLEEALRGWVDARVVAETPYCVLLLSRRYVLGDSDVTTPQPKVKSRAAGTRGIESRTERERPREGG